jgi:uncharacterized phage protein (TIGR01671 family)
MREIKFRAWDAETQEMHLPEDYRHDTVKTTSAHFLKHFDCVEQWTGLHDKNGIEIYEGDIVTGTYYQFGQKYNFTGEVKYVITAFKVVGTKSYNGMHQELNSIYEIIGNIHTQKP